MPKDVSSRISLSADYVLKTLVSVVLDKYHWMLFFLTPAMYPRFLITLDEELNSMPVTVRVGQVSISGHLFPVICLLTCHLRLSMLLAKLASQEQSPASRPTRRLSGWAQQNAPSLRQRSTSHIQVSWRTLSSYRKTLDTRRRTRWSCRLIYLLCNDHPWTCITLIDGVLLAGYSSWFRHRKSVGDVYTYNLRSQASVFPTPTFRRPAANSPRHMRFQWSVSCDLLGNETHGCDRPSLA